MMIAFLSPRILQKGARIRFPLPFSSKPLPIAYLANLRVLPSEPNPTCVDWLEMRDSLTTKDRTIIGPDNLALVLGGNDVDEA